MDDAPRSADEILVNNGKRTLTLNELARSMPGMDRLMVEIGYRAGCLYHAAKAGNWKLAGYFCRTLGKHLDHAAFVRPKYAESMAEFLSVDYAPVRKAIGDEDWDAFEGAFHEMVGAANAYHEIYDKEFLRWKIPSEPPPDLDFTPRA